VEGVVNADNVIRFRNRTPTKAALEIYRRMTRNWSDEMKQLMFPDHYEADHRGIPSSRANRRPDDSESHS
jgi:hypothetical protein